MDYLYEYISRYVDDLAMTSRDPLAIFERGLGQYHITWGHISNEIMMVPYIWPQASTSIRWWIHVSAFLASNPRTYTVHLCINDTTQTWHFPWIWYWGYKDLSFYDWSRSVGCISWTFGCFYWHNDTLKLLFCTSLWLRQLDLIKQIYGHLEKTRHAKLQLCISAWFFCYCHSW